MRAPAGCAPGVVGLQNLGNTCFMNSALQCLFHCLPLVRYFLSSTFQQDINTDNPLGHGGEIARIFAALLDPIWRGGVRSVAPRGFKRTMAKFTHLCQGTDQHDSQDLLSVLLDMLHEDLNRVKKKPYIEEEDADERKDDAVLAAEAWEQHRCALVICQCVSVRLHSCCAAFGFGKE